MHASLPSGLQRYTVFKNEAVAIGHGRQTGSAFIVCRAAGCWSWTTHTVASTYGCVGANSGHYQACQVYRWHSHLG